MAVFTPLYIPEHDIELLNILERHSQKEMKSSPFKKELFKKLKALSSARIFFINIYSHLLGIAHVGSPENPVRGGYTSMLGFINSEFSALICLSQNGLDVAARGKLRTFSEGLDFLMLFNIEGKLVEEFHQCVDLEKSQHFWHAHFSKGKARKKINQYIGLEEDKLSYEKNWDDRLSTIVHPSFLAGCWSAFYLENKNDNKTSPFSFMGKFGDAQIETLEYSAYICCKFLTVFEKTSNDNRNTLCNLFDKSLSGVFIYNSQVVLEDLRKAFPDMP